MKQLLLYFILLFALPAYSAPHLSNSTIRHRLLQNPVSGFTSVNSKGAKVILAQQPGMVILDVRTPQEFAGGHLQNAVNLNYNAPDFAAKIAELDKNKAYLVYCAVGGRSSKAAKLMQEQGFKKVVNITEGYTQLKLTGLNVQE